MRDNARRDVTFLDLLLKAEPVHAPRHSIDYFLENLQTLHSSNNTEKWNRNRSQKTFIRDLEINADQQFALLLLYHNNGNASPASYAHLDTNSQRTEPPQEREGRPESAHLLISTRSSNQSEHRYLAILEDSAKINRQVVQSYLNFLFREVKKIDPQSFEANHPDGSRLPNGDPRTYKYTNKFELQGHPSEEFNDMLINGKLTGIALETAQQERMVIADGSHVMPSKSEIRLRPVSGKWHENARTKLNEALRLGRGGNYEKTRITFIAPDTKSHTVHLDTQSGNVIGDSFIKKNRLNNFSTILEEADTRINQEIRIKMLEIFR